MGFRCTRWRCGLDTLSRTAQLAARGRLWVPYFVIWLSAIALFAGVAISAERALVRLGDPAIATGYWLFGVMVFLALFNARKRAQMIPLLRAKWWTMMHLVGGILAIALFWTHTRTLWPTGPYEQALSVLFYLLTLSGLLGWLVERTTPSRLTQTGVEVIFERIPDELTHLRERAEAIVLECTTESNADTLARIYVETFDWFFRRPRFILSHLWGGRQGAAWLFQQTSTVKRYLNQTERGYLDQLQELGSVKNRIDYNYVAQGLMKTWLLAHVPIAAAVLCLSAWHLILIHVYAI